MSSNDRKCERCGLMRPNCGPWREDGQRFASVCGPCKIAATMTPERRTRMDALVSALGVEVARQEKAEAIDTEGVEVASLALPAAHPSGRGACPEDEPCAECARVYSEPDAEPVGDDAANARAS